MIKKNTAIRWHSRAGQGAITAANFFAENAFKQGFLSNSFPDFGAEKRGAAVKVFNKISKTGDDSFIMDSSHPLEVDAVVLFDRTLATAELGYEAIIEGLQEEGFLLVNARQDARSKYWKNFPGKIYHVDGSGIALETIKRDIPNVCIVGALVKILGMDQEKSRENLKVHLLEFFPQKIVDINLISFDKGFSEVKEVF